MGRQAAARRGRAPATLASPGHAGGDRRRLGAERARGRGCAGAGGRLGARPRARRHDRRRHPLGGADAARVRARRLRRHPSPQPRVAVSADAAARTTTGSSGCSRRRRSRTPSTTARAVVLERSIAATGATLGADAARYAG